MAESVEICDAVIITNDADSYLKDISYGEPTCLLPLVNVPTIHYLMIQLLYGKMRNFTIFCGKNRKVIEKFFTEVDYNNYANCDLTFDFVDDGTIETVGDAIRYLDKKEFDKEFVLVHGDLITNCDIGQLVKSYQDARRNNPSIISSKVISIHYDYTKCCDGLFYDKSTNIITSNGTSFKNATDSQIYICSKLLRLRFHENLDCSTMDDIVSQVLATSDVVNDVFHVIYLKDDFCIRIQTLNSYFLATCNIIRCSIFRCSPKHLFRQNINAVASSGQIKSTHQTSYISKFLPKDFMHGSSRFVGNVQVMEGSKIGKNSRLFDTVIGKNCIIGNNVILKNCVLLDDVKVDDNCLVSETFIGKRVRIEEFCQLTDKCIIENDYVVLKRSKLKRQRLSKKGLSNIWDKEIIYENLHELVNPNNDADDDFETDMHELLKQALEEDISLKNLKIDVGKLQMDYEKSGEDMCLDLCIVFVKYPLKVPSEEKYGLRVLHLFEKYGQLIGSFVGRDRDCRKLCLEAIEECACQDEVLLMKVSDIVYSMYNCDLVNKTDIRVWYKDSELLKDEDMMKQAAVVRVNLTKFMEYLDEEDDSEDDSDDEEDSEDD